MSFQSLLNQLLLGTIVLLTMATTPINAQQVLETHGDSLRADFNNSLEQWNLLKAQHNDSYEYAVSWQSAFGFGHVTTVTVKEGKVVSRIYREDNSPDYEAPKDEGFEDIWVEDSIKLGTFLKPTDGGFRGITLDQVYKECGEIHLQMDEDRNWLYFTTNNAAILRVCSYSPMGCEDDCSTGVTISKFKWLE